MDAMFVPGLNPHSPVGWWEISPCLLFDDETEAFETFEEAEAQSDEAQLPCDEATSPVFYGVYMKMRHEAIDAGMIPGIHVCDFTNFEEALGFVTCVNGVPEMTYAETDK